MKTSSSNANVPTETTPIQGTTQMNPTQNVIAFATQNLEAVATATKIWTAGVQDLAAQFATTAKASLEESVAAFKALTSVKSIKEAIDLQSTYSKNMISKTLAETNHLTGASLKLTENTLAPITARVAATVDTFAKAA